MFYRYISLLIFITTISCNRGNSPNNTEPKADSLLNKLFTTPSEKKPLIDSMIFALDNLKVNDTNYVNLAKRVSKNYPLLKTFPDSAFKELTALKETAKNNHYPYLEFFCLEGLTTINHNRSDYINATKGYLEIIERAEKLNYYDRICKAYRNLSSMKVLQGDGEGAMRYADEAAKVADKYSLQKEVGKVYVNKAGACQALGDTAGERKWYLKAEEVFLQQGDLENIGWIYTGIGKMYYPTDNEMGLEYLIKADSIFKKTGWVSPIVLSNRGNIASIFYNYSLSDSLMRSIKNKSFPKTKQLMMAAAEKAMRDVISDSKDAPANVAFFKGNLALLLETKGDYKGAYETLQQAKHLNDSIYSQKNKNQIAKIEAEKDMAIVKADNRNKTLWNYILMASAAALLLIAGLVFRNFIYQRKLNRQLQTIQQQKIQELQKNKQLQAVDAMLKGQEKERSRLAKDLHDGLGGLLSVTKMSLANVKENVLMKPEQQTSFESAISQLDNAIGELRKIAHNLMPETLAKYGLENSLENYFNTLQKPSSVSIQYQKMGIDRKLTDEADLYIYRIIQELVHNALKYSCATQILVQTTKSATATDITVEDNGVGFDKDVASQKNSIGYASIRDRINYLGGSLDLHTSPGEGTSVNIHLNV